MQNYLSSRGLLSISFMPELAACCLLTGNHPMHVSATVDIVLDDIYKLTDFLYGSMIMKVRI
jgi:hypothetical protein